MKYSPEGLSGVTTDVWVSGILGSRLLVVGSSPCPHFPVMNNIHCVDKHVSGAYNLPGAVLGRGHRDTAFPRPVGERERHL